MKNNEFCWSKSSVFSIMTHKIFIIAALVLLSSWSLDANAKKKKENERPVTVLTTQSVENESLRTIEITDPVKQMNGRWYVVELNNEELSLPRGKFAYLDFDVEVGMIYGFTGFNRMNVGYKYQSRDKFKINNDIAMTSHDGGYFKHTEEKLINNLRRVETITLTQEGDNQFMELKNKNNVLVKLRRQNLDFLNGMWLVRSINGKDVRYCDIMMINDIAMNSVTIISDAKDSNIINGVVYPKFNTANALGLEYEDLKSSHNQWQYIDTETRLLIALEETEFCRTTPYDEVELCTTETDEMGNDETKVLVVLQKERD